MSLSLPRVTIFLFPLLASLHGQVHLPPHVIVDVDESGDFTTIQAAIDSTRNESMDPIYIYIKRGTYFEKVLVPAYKRHLHFYGEGHSETVISWNDYNGKSPNVVINNSYTMQIQGNDCSLRDLTVQNTAGFLMGQAVALDVIGDRTTVRSCNILGHQDTLYARGNGSRSYIHNCFIQGTTDFIFGSGTVIFEHCTLSCLKDSTITAASTLTGRRFGYVFRNCSIVKGLDRVKNVFLGRPWGPYAQTVFLSTQMGDFIRREGWKDWNDTQHHSETVFFAEYGTMGVDVSERVPWSQQLTTDQAALYTTFNVFNGWIPPQ